MPDHYHHYRFITAFAILFVLTFLVYGNSFNNGWIYDDYPNILENKNIRLSEINCETVLKTFKGPENSSNRPIAFLTFALNYYFTGYDVFWYHVVNFAIHFTVSLLVLLILYATLKLDPTLVRFENHFMDMALLGTAFWATSPLHVMAVTGIVQRMCSLSALFYLLALYLYIKTRLSSSRRIRACLPVCMIFAFALSLGAKENSAMLPLAILLYEFIFFQKDVFLKIKNYLGILMILCVFILAVNWLYIDFSTILEMYRTNRYFTIAERLMTEPRIIFFYLSQIINPDASLLTILHDIELSTSLLHPWTTIPSIAGVLILNISAVLSVRRFPLFSYAILFYFINHLIESTVIPLELAYEHRNYLPSVFLYLFISIGLIYFIFYFSPKKTLKYSAASLTVFLLFSQGHTTYLRNIVLRPGVCWLDNIRKAPGHSTVLTNLGSWYINDTTDQLKAVHLWQKALELGKFNNISQPAICYENLGNYYATEGQRNYKLAIEYFEKLKDSQPHNKGVHIRLIHIFLLGDQHDKALAYLKYALEMWPHDVKLLYFAAVTDLKNKKFESAEKWADKMSGTDHSALEPFWVRGELARQGGNYGKAIWIFKYIASCSPNDKQAALALVELYYRVGDYAKLADQINLVLRFKENKTWDEYITEFNKTSPVYAYVPDKKIILSAVESFLTRQIEQVREIEETENK